MSKKRMSDLKKRIDNLFTKLRLDEKSIIFGRGDDLNEKTIIRLGRSKYDKDKILNNLYKEFKKEGAQVKNLKSVAVIYTSFIYKKSVTQRDHMLHTIDIPMKLFTLT